MDATDNTPPATLAMTTSLRCTSSRLMDALDRVNRTFGRQTLRFASEAIGEQWRTRARLRSPAYTTRWNELPRVKAC